jgi:ArsR family transcriptional regulator, lead/cadmium/zinc/bismuth-responsive transcriptional repressor
MSINEYPHKCLNILGNELRINILNSLKEKNKTVNELSKNLNQEQSKISHSLKKLRHCNFVDYKQQGKQRIYFLKSKILTEKSNKPLFELIEEHAVKFCNKKIKKKERIK